MANWFRQAMADFLPGVRIIDIGRTQGTDDPFVVIDESTLRQLPDWRDLILGTLS
jgi:hypothetical protein